MARELQYQGLAELPVIIEDNSRYSAEYFQITKFPELLTAGKNLFRFKGSDKFIEESDVLIEVLDSNGQPIYYEADLDLESTEQSVIVSIYVDEETPPGAGEIILCGYVATTGSISFTEDDFQPNMRWRQPIDIDPIKQNVTEIIFGAMPNVSVNTSSVVDNYTITNYQGNALLKSASIYNFTYDYRNGDNPVIYGTISAAALSGIDVNGSGVFEVTRSKFTGKPNPDTGLVLTSQVLSGSIIDYISTGSTTIFTIDFPFESSIQGSNQVHTFLNGTGTTGSLYFEQTSSTTSSENTYTIISASFTGLSPQVGNITKIRTFYKSVGVGEYVLASETDITDQASEFGYTPESASIIVPLPTVHRNDKFDLKFQFLNFADAVSKQVLYVKDVGMPGGNVYIGGDDNLITGSIYIAGQTGAGVSIEGSTAGAFIRSVGYEGFQNVVANGATGTPGFIMYSGSIATMLNSSQTENYRGIGLELTAHSESYLRYTTSGSGLLDIRTNRFFLGGTGQYIVGADGLIQISSSNFFLSSSGDVIMQGTITANAGRIGGFTITSHSLSGNNFFISGAATSTGFFISASKFNVKGNGDITGSNVLFTGGKIAGWTVDSDKLSSGNVTLNATNQQIFLGNTTYDAAEIAFTGSGIGKFGSININGEAGALNGGTAFLDTFNGTELDSTLWFNNSDNAGEKARIISGALRLENDDFNWNYAIVGKKSFQRANSAVVEFHTKVLTITPGGTGAVAAPRIMMGFTDKTGSTNYADNVHAFYFSTGSLQIYEGSTQRTTLDTNVAVGDTYKLILKPNTTSGTQYEIYRNEDYTTVFKTGSIGTNNTASLYPAIWTYPTSSTMEFYSVAAYDSTTPGAFDLKGGGSFGLIDNSGSHLTFTRGGFSLSSPNVDITGRSIRIGDAFKFDGSNLTVSGSSTKILTPSFFLGGTGQYISGSGGLIRISSSNFHLDTAGNVTMAGTVTATAGSIGGFIITSDAITGSGFYLSGSATSTGFFISSSKFNIKGNGDITGSQVLFTGGQIGGLTLASDKIYIGTGTYGNSNTSFLVNNSGQFSLKDSFQWNGTDLLISGSTTRILTPTFYLGGVNQFISGANGNIEISSSNFHLDRNGNVRMSGTITATAGTIGGFAITSTAISSSNNSLILRGDSGIITGSNVLFTGGKIGSFTLSNNALSGINSSTSATTFFISSSVDTTSPDGVAFFISSSRFNVRQDGTISGSRVLFDGGKVGGFTIDSTKITGTNIIINSAGSLQTADYASNQTGWKISAVDNGFAEFENVRVRGTLKTAVFEKETVNAVGGQLYVANSSTITGSEALTSIPQLVYLKFGGYSGSNAIQNIAGSGNTYLTIGSLVTASIANLPTSTQTFKPIGGTGLLIASGSKTIPGLAETNVAQLSGITTAESASLTVMAWVRPNFSSYTTSTPTGSILEKSGSITASSLRGPFYIGFVVQSSTTASLRISTGNESDLSVFDRSNVLRNDTWTHIALTVAPNGANYTRTVYVDGIQNGAPNNATSASVNLFSKVNTSPINIGVGRSYSERFPGYIADVRVYTGSLSAAEIRTIYSGSYITGSIEAGTPALQIDNVTGFINGEILSAKKVDNTGFATEYFQVRDTMRLNPSSDTDFSGMLYVTRSYGNGVSGDSGSLGDMPNEAQSYSPSQVIVSTGKIGTGFIRINANPNDQTTPYIDIVERTGSGIYDVKLKARLGDLSGLADSSYVFGNSNPGFGLATDNVFLQGGIIANTGSIGGIKMQSSKLFTGTGIFNNNNTGFYLDDNSQFSLGNKLSWNGSVLSVSGTLNATDGNIGGFAITANAITGSGFYLSGSATNDGASFFLSSSRFNIKGNGDVTGSQVLFTGGKIGGFNITSTQIADVGGSTLLLKDSGQITGSNVLFTGGKIGSFTLNNDAFSNGSNFFISSSYNSANPSGSFFISSSRFNVRQDGTVSGSNVFFNGGKIGAFTLSNDAFTAGSTFFISSSANTANPSGSFFISSSRFNIKQDGTVTGSNVLFNGGTIGGFTIGASSLTATDFAVNTTAGEIELGATSFALGDGIYMSKATTNNFRVGDQNGARMQFTGDNLEIYNSGNTKLVSIGASNTIAGFTLSDSTLSNSTNFFISGSATGNQFFISASNFNVKANGNVTASNMLLNGGVIRSANYSTTAGSEVNLADGTFNFGGSSTYYPGIRFDGTTLSVKGDVTADTGNFLNVNVRGSVTTTFFTGSDEFLSTGAIEKTTLESWTTSSGTPPTTGWSPITTGSLMSGSVSGISFRLPWKAPRLLWDVGLSTPTETLTNIVRSCSYDQGPTIGTLKDTEWDYSADSTLYGLPIGTTPYQAGLSFRPQTSGATGITQWNFTTGSWQGIRLENVALTTLTLSNISRPAIVSDRVLIVGFTPDTNRSITARVIVKASSNYPSVGGQTTYPFYVTTYDGNESEAFVLKIPLSGIAGYSIFKASQYFEIENGKVDIEIQWKFTGYMGTAPTGVASTRLHEVKILDVPRVDNLAVRNLSIGTGYKSSIVFEPIYPEFNIGVNKAAKLRLRNPSYKETESSGFHDLIVRNGTLVGDTDTVLSVGATASLFGTPTALIYNSKTGTETDAQLEIGGNGYSGVHFLDATAYYIGQNSAARFLRMYSDNTAAGVSLTAGSTSWGTFSDERLKFDIAPISNSLEALNSVRCVTYRLKDVDTSESQKRIGIIAQDLVGKLDEVLSEEKRANDTDTYFSVRYTELIPVLIKAVQEQQQMIEQLEKKIDELSSK